MGCGSSRIGPDLPAANNWKQWPAGSYPTRFVELASPEDADDTAGNGFLFVESCAYNKIFDADNFYVPVQHTDSSCHIYKVSVSDGSKKAERLHQVVKKSDGEKMISPFGSALSDEGVLWLCCFNENMVCGVDLSSGEMVVEGTEPAPNDICVSDDGKYVYAGSGSWLGKVPLAAGAGTIWRVTTAAPYTCKKVVGRAQGTMAGIAEVKGKLFCAHLQRMSVYGSRRKMYELSGLKKQIWTGLCSQDADPEKVDKFYLADNLAWWDAEKPRKVILTPAYRSLPAPLGHILDRSTGVNAVGWSAARAATTLLRLKEGGIEEVAKVNDDGLSPEVDLKFSKGDDFPHVHLCLYNTETGATANHVFLLDKAVQGADFDGHVTHAEHVGDGKVACVNFLKRKVLIIDTKGLITLP